MLNSSALIALIALVAASPTLGEPPGIYDPPHLGRSPDDLATETFLREAEVLSVEDIGEGITHPFRIELAQGDRRARAIFKTVDIESRDPHYTSTFEMHFTDRYAYEVAAYRLDRFLGIGLTPPTVIRTIGEEEGAVQLWIEDAIKMQDAMDRDLPAGDVNLFLQRKVMMNVLDSLIHNIDRNPSNILVRPSDDGYWLIDHSRAFRESTKIPFYIKDWSIPAPEGMRERLQALDREALDAMMAGLIGPKQIKAILKRRDRVLKLMK